MSSETYLYTARRDGGVNPGRRVVIDSENLVDGETPLEDFSPFFTLPVLMDQDTADSVYLGIVCAIESGEEVDVQAIYEKVLHRY